MDLYDFNNSGWPVPAHQHSNGGGWVADTAIVHDDAYIGPEARVYGNAFVDAGVVINDQARVFGFVNLFDNVIIFGDASVSGDAKIGGCVRVFGNAGVCGRTHISDCVQISGNTFLTENAKISGSSRIYGYTNVYGDVNVHNDKWTWGENESPSLESQIILLDKIREIVLEDTNNLNMKHWHCGTSHCLAGWAQFLSGLENYESAYEFGVKTIPVAAPLFFENEKTVIDWLTSRGYVNEET